VPLEQERASRTNDEDAVRAATSDQLSEYEARFDRLAKTNIIGDEQPWTRHAERPHYGNELVRCETQPTRLSCKQRVRSKRLFQEESLMQDAPILKPRRSFGVYLRCDRSDRFEGDEDVELLAPESPFKASKSVELLLPSRLSKHDLPTETPSGNLGPWQKFLHPGRR
jgi:hypothetical protein